MITFCPKFPAIPLTENVEFWSFAFVIWLSLTWIAEIPSLAILIPESVASDNESNDVP